MHRGAWPVMHCRVLEFGCCGSDPWSSSADRATQMVQFDLGLDVIALGSQDGCCAQVYSCLARINARPGPGLSKAQPLEPTR